MALPTRPRWMAAGQAGDAVTRTMRVRRTGSAGSVLHKSNHAGGFTWHGSLMILKYSFDAAATINSESFLTNKINPNQQLQVADTP